MLTAADVHKVVAVSPHIYHESYNLTLLINDVIDCGGYDTYSYVPRGEEGGRGRYLLTYELTAVGRTQHKFTSHLPFYDMSHDNKT